MDKQKKVAADEYCPQLFDVFLPKYNAKRMHIPNDFVKYLQGRVLKKAILKSPEGKLWLVTLCNIKGKSMYFENGWEKFTKDNLLQVGRFITFSFDGNNTFNFKIYKRNRCEMVETYEEEKEEEESDSVEMLEEDANEEDDTDVEEEKEEQVKNRKNLSSCSRTKRIINIEDCGINAEKYVQPDNPCFVYKPGTNRKKELHIPSPIRHDFCLRLQQHQRIILRRRCKDLPKHEVEGHHHHEERQEKKEWEGEVIKSKDRRLCIREWGSFCRGIRI